MFTEFMIFVALMFVFMLIFIGMMEWEEPPAVMFSIFLAIVGASMYGASDDISVEVNTTTVSSSEINATSLQNVVDEFQERIVKLEERKCTCEPVMVIAPVETPDPYGTGY